MRALLEWAVTGVFKERITQILKMNIFIKVVRFTFAGYFSIIMSGILFAL